MAMMKTLVSMALVAGAIAASLTSAHGQRLRAPPVGSILGPSMMGPDFRVCSPRGAGYTDWRNDRIESAISLSEPQRSAFETPDLDDNRLEVAKRFGATAVISSADGNAFETVMKMTGGRGVDTAIEAVGVPATFELCEKIVAPGSTIPNIGVHGTKVDLHLENLWDRNITITTRLVDTVSTAMLLNTVQADKIDAKLLITHHFKLGNIIDAYETFAHAADTRALKVIIEA